MNGGQSIGKAQVLFPVRRCHGGCHGVNSDEMEISRRTNVYQNQQTCLICSPQPKSMGHVTGAAKPDLALQPPAPSSSSSHPSHPILSLSLSLSVSPATFDSPRLRLRHNFAAFHPPPIAQEETLPILFPPAFFLLCASSPVCERGSMCIRDGPLPAGVSSTAGMFPQPNLFLFTQTFCALG